MGLSDIKTIVVKFSEDNIVEFDIDTDNFSDPLMEAGTRAIENTKVKGGVGAIIGPVAKCWDKQNPNKSIVYNTYWLLVNAACYKKAEQLRDKFMMQEDVDLAKQPYHGRTNRK